MKMTSISAKWTVVGSLFCLIALVGGYAASSSWTSNPGCRCPDKTTFSKDVWNGTIKSPNFPGFYCAGLTCLWVVKKGHPGTGIRLHFESFDVELGADWLDIYFIGEREVVHKLTRLTGTVETGSLPNYVINSDGGFELELRTDSSSQRRGFLAHFSRFNITSTACGCQDFMYTVTATPLAITSPGYPDPYCHNLQCYYLIKARPLHSVHIQFSDFDLENRYDSVTIYDGDTGENVLNSKKLAVLNGTVGRHKQFTSHQSTMMLIFKSDGDTNHKGFRAIVTEVPGPCRCNNQTMTADTGNFSSPGYPTGYCGTLNCTYSIQVRESKVVQLEFPVFRLLAGDSVFIEIPDGSGLPLMKWRGTYSFANFRFTSNSKSVKLRMVSEAAGGAVGFNATYRTIDRTPDCSCPDQMPKMVGSLSGNLSHTACGPLDCFYVLPHPGDNYNLLTVWVDSVSIHPANDWFRIYKGRFTLEGYPESVRTFSGHVTNHSAIGISTEPSQQIMLYFHTEKAATHQDSGFKIRYRWASQICSCGPLALTASMLRKTVTSPGYPIPYCNSLNCKWVIRAPLGHRVVLNFTDFMTEPSDTDNVGVYEGITTNMDTRIQLYKGDLKEEMLPPVTRSVGNVVTVWFTTDRSVVFRGWNLTYYCEPAEPPVDLPVPSHTNETSANPHYWWPDEHPLHEQTKFVVETLPQSSMVWSFSSGVFLGVLVCICVFGIGFLVRRTGRCRGRWTSDSSVAYVRYPGNGHHASSDNEAYAGSEPGYVVSEDCS